MADKLLLKGRSPMMDDAQGVADALDKVNRKYFPPNDCASDQWEIVARPPFPSHFKYEKAMLPRPREVSRGIQRPPLVISIKKLGDAPLRLFMPPLKSNEDRADFYPIVWTFCILVFHRI